MLMIGAERRLEDVRRELISMRAFFKDTIRPEEVGVEVYNEWLHDLNDVALNAEDVLETFFDKTVRRSWIFSLVDQFKLHVELYGISKKMRKLCERRMKYDQSHRSPNAESQPETSCNASLVREVEKLSYILNENLFGSSELKNMIKLSQRLMKYDQSQRSTESQTETSVVPALENRNITERKKLYDIAKIEGSMHGRSEREIQIVVEQNDNYGTEEDPLLPACVASSSRRVEDIPNTAVESDSEIQIVVEQNDNSGTEEDLLLPPCMTNSQVKDIPNTAVELIREDLQLKNALFHDVEEMEELDGRSNIWLMSENNRELESVEKEYASKVENKSFSISKHLTLLGSQSKMNQTRSNILESSRLRKRNGIYLQAREESLPDFSIDNMPQYLMRCLSYFVLFPAKFEIPARRLIVLWVAQGLVRHERGSPEEAAESYLQELINLKMVLTVKEKRNGKVKTCRLYDHWSQSESFHRYLKIHSTDSDLVADHHNENDKLYNYIHGDNITASASLKKLCKDVRSFLTFDTRNGSKPGQDIGQFLNRCITSGCFLLLRVLDLERVYKPQLPENIASLSRLRYLGLRWTYLESLPSSISSLLYLQTLDLKNTYINILTSSIWKMQLRHLFLSEAYRTRFPTHPRRNHLSDLQTLWGLFVDEKTQVKGGLDRLVNIKKLRLACQSMSPDEKEMESQLKVVAEWIVKLKDLQTLRVKSRKEDGEPGDLHLESLENHKHLTDMYLLGILKSPSIKSLFPRSLTDLTLSHSELKHDSIEILGDLQKLRSLYLLAGSYIEETLCCKKGSFPQLRYLKIWKLEQLKEWNIEDGAFPRLLELEIRSCKCLHMLPNGLQHLNFLFELKLTTMSENLMEKIRSVDMDKVPRFCKVFYCYIKEGEEQLTCEPLFLRNAYWKSNQLDPLKGSTQFELGSSFKPLMLNIRLDKLMQDKLLGSRVKKEEKRKEKERRREDQGADFKGKEGREKESKEEKKKRREEERIKGQILRVKERKEKERGREY